MHPTETVQTGLAAPADKHQEKSGENLLGFCQLILFFFGKRSNHLLQSKQDWQGDKGEVCTQSNRSQNK